MDQYQNFNYLHAFEREGVDFRIRWRVGCSGIAVLSIHGGDIEPGTSEIADAIAGSEHTFYSLEGLKETGNKVLHITSTVFDEPMALEIICQSEVIVSVHGCSGQDPVVWLGGLDRELNERIRECFRAIGITVRNGADGDFPASDLANICNLCGRGMGTQLEISRGLREQMFEHLMPREKRRPTRNFHLFVEAVREVLEPFGLPAGDSFSEGLER